MTIGEVVYSLAYAVPAAIFLGFALGSMFRWISFG